MIECRQPEELVLQVDDPTTHSDEEPVTPIVSRGLAQRELCLIEAGSSRNLAFDPWNLNASLSELKF